MHNPSFFQRAVAGATALILALSLAAPAAADDDDDDDGDDRRTYQVTIAIVGGFEDNGQPLTPPLIVATEHRHDLFKVGRRASFELQQIAENGNLGPALTEFGDAVGADAPLVPAGSPGDASFDQSVTLTIVADEDERFLSWASMLICTNDGFTGLNSLRLPRRVGGSVTAFTAGYDAGTEVNTEDFADMVPPCQGLIGVSSGEPGTGMTNPALAEGGRIRHHPGISGGADLDPDVHGWTDPVAMVVVTRVG